MIKQGLHEKCGFHSDILHGIPWFSNIVLHGITILNCMVLHSQEWQFVVDIAWYSVEKYCTNTMVVIMIMILMGLFFVAFPQFGCW